MFDLFPLFLGGPQSGFVRFSSFFKNFLLGLCYCFKALGEIFDDSALDVVAAVIGLYSAYELCKIRYAAVSSDSHT